MRTNEEATRPVLVFTIDGHHFAAALDCVERVFAAVETTPLPGAPAIARGVINLAGALVPVLDLRRRLGLLAAPERLAERLVIASTARRRVALAVDAVLGVERIEMSALGAAPAILPGLGEIAAVAATAQGVLVIHELDRFLSLDEERELGNAIAAHAGAAADDRSGAAADR